MPRLFIALELPPPPRQVLAALCSGLPGARWVSPELLHLTLRFLGQVPEDQVAGLRQKLTGVSAAAFRAGVQGVGVFPQVPSRRKPARVLWAGVSPAEPVAALKQALDAALGPDPEIAEQGYSPHVTLARFKLPPAPDALARFLDQHRTLATEPFAVDAFTLYESRTLPTGSVYTAVARFPLQATG
jgi:2'-5' RNA ligase